MTATTKSERLYFLTSCALLLVGVKSRIRSCVVVQISTWLHTKKTYADTVLTKTSLRAFESELACPLRRRSSQKKPIPEKNPLLRCCPDRRHALINQAVTQQWANQESIDTAKLLKQFVVYIQQHSCKSISSENAWPCCERQRICLKFVWFNRKLEAPILGVSSTLSWKDELCVVGTASVPFRWMVDLVDGLLCWSIDPFRKKKVPWCKVVFLAFDGSRSLAGSQR